MRPTAGSAKQGSYRQLVVAAARTLAAAGCEQARLDAELLLTHVLGVSRAYLYAHPEGRLTDEERVCWEDALRRRARREPLAYIVGFREFYGLSFAVDPRVLIPRPETELLIERALAVAGTQPLRTVWDVGTGSGALALTLARHLPAAQVVGSDLSDEALAVAALNRRRLGLERRVQLVHADLLSAARGPLDLVVANLPYLRADECATVMPEVSCFEPRQALDGGVDGLGLVKRLLRQAAALEPVPALLLEIGAGQGPAVLDLARQAFPGRAVAVLPDYAGWDRILEIAARTSA